MYNSIHHQACILNIHQYATITGYVATIHDIFNRALLVNTITVLLTLPDLSLLLDLKIYFSWKSIFNLQSTNTCVVIAIIIVNI